eukprot:CAMPEP_0115316518 /NCGR_PEP_ID=MMETSP0270-20121206/78168_1 /TAXON_ID=71861 /ORGANISM="Scrippsiella trochoidea, Strain CCMP3099" /LENGTH=136 /DNA_ID=CAMNT_0002735935 /DNA_START=9 /DNA_END=417 /DNA_ORIENTATION=-
MTRVSPSNVANVANGASHSSSRRSMKEISRHASQWYMKRLEKTSKSFKKTSSLGSARGRACRRPFSNSGSWGLKPGQAGAATTSRTKAAGMALHNNGANFTSLSFWSNHVSQGQPELLAAISAEPKQRHIDAASPS